MLFCLKNIPVKIISIAFVLFATSIEPINYQLYDLSKLTGEKLACATSINNAGQIGGIGGGDPWFVWDAGQLKKISIYLSSSTFGLGCPPYIDSKGNLSKEFVNDLGQKPSINQGKLYVNGALIDSDSVWGEAYAINMNNNQQLVGAIKCKSGKVQAKYINLKNNTSKVLPLKYSCYPTCINESGDIVGYFLKEGKFHSFLWNPENDNWQFIPNFRAAAINNNRIIVGQTSKGAFWKNGTIYIVDDIFNLDQDMSTDIETITFINDINDKNEMVGYGVSGQRGRL